MEIRSVLFVLLGTSLGIFFGTLYNTSEISGNTSFKTDEIVRDSNKLGEESLGTLTKITDDSIHVFVETSDEIPARTIQFMFHNPLEVYSITHLRDHGIYRAESVTVLDKNALMTGQRVYIKHYLKGNHIFAEQIFIMQ